MRIALTERFQSDVSALDDACRAAIFQTMLALPGALGHAHAHAHAGPGLRKIHASGIWEARVGLGLRLIFTLVDQTVTLVRAGTHDDVRRFLRSL